MPSPSRSLLRLPIQIAVWTLLLVALLGPHTHWSVCLTGACTQRAEANLESGCTCCEHDATADRRGEGDGENGGDKCPGCCLDLAMAIDDGPLPRPVQAPEVDHQDVVAVLPALVFDSGTALAARFSGHDTGPPRIDRRTALIATTILRE